jgi:hypothetical protein
MSAERDKNQAKKTGDSQSSPGLADPLECSDDADEDEKGRSVELGA